MKTWPFTLPPCRSSTQIRWGVMCFLLIALSGQIALNSFSRSGELPRTTILRLTGIDIAPSCTQKHHHTAPSHHHDAGCPLCPLLGHFIFTLPFSPLWRSPLALPIDKWLTPLQSRAPPPSPYEHPPGRAPPVVPEMIVHLSSTHND